MHKKHLIHSLVKLLALLISLHFSGVSQAKEAIRIYKYNSVSGTTSFSDIEPINVYYEVVKLGCYACYLNSHIDWQKSKLYLDLFTDTINHAANLYQMDPAFIRAIIHAESHFDHQAVSKQGAQGLMQLMPATAKSLGVDDPFVAEQNIPAGTKHLARLLKKYHGNRKLAAAAYNAGEGNVKKYHGIPPFKETKVYIERVEILHKRYQKAAL
mgnify:CR=1 FL=1